MVARPNAPWAGAPARKDDAFLARPFRHQHSKSPGRVLDVVAERHAASQCAWKFRHARQKNLTRPGDDDLSRFATEPAGTPERELGARVDGAVHGRYRQLHRAGHPRIGARFYRLSHLHEDTTISVRAISTGSPAKNFHGRDRQLPQ